MAKFDVENMVTERVIAMLEEGNIPWNKPWFGAKNGAFSHKTGKPYSLLNQILLGDDHEYTTKAEIRRHKNAKLRKGSKPKQVVFWKFYPRTVTLEDGTEEEHNFAILRYYNVFDIADVDGMAPRERRKIGTAEADEQAEEIVENYVAKSGVRISRNGVSNEAFYNPTSDCIVVPELDQYDETAEYYSTLFHEMTHSTGHKSRLDRLESSAYFGDDDYSKEELVAELGAASLVNYCGLEVPESFRNSVAYIQGWLKALKDDKKLIISAAGRAQKAVNYILGDTAEIDEAETEKVEKPENAVEVLEEAEKTAEEPKTEEQTEQPKIEEVPTVTEQSVEELNATKAVGEQLEFM